jgi:tRNA (guanine-N7-)-methyltransferase
VVFGKIMENRKNRTIYGRRQSRSLRDSQKNLWEQLFNDVKIDLQNLPASYPENIIFEIGFGGGENLAHQAMNNPDYTCIGCEPFINGVSSLLTKISENNIENIRIFNDDATILLKSMPDQLIKKMFVLFPDPWPKKRHNRRRVVNLENLLLMHKKMQTAGELIIATDHPGYLEWIIAIIEQPIFLKYFKVVHTPDLPRPSEEEIPVTRYEKKALENRPGAFFKFIA